MRQSENEVKISSPIFTSNNRFLASAEENSDSIYLISGSNILWQNDLEGSISRVNVNKNGYVSVIIKTTIYKSVVVLSIIITPFLSNKYETQPVVPRFPPALSKACLTSAAVLFLLSVLASTITATPFVPYPS